MMIVPPFSSCSDTGYMFFLSYNPCYLAKGGSIIIYIEGGVPPYVWEVDESSPCFSFEGAAGEEEIKTEGDLYGLTLEDGTLLSTEGGGSVATNTQYIQLNASKYCDYTDVDPFYHETIKVTDACGTTDTMEIYLCDTDVCCDDPAYAFSWNIAGSATFVKCNGYALVRVTGGCPPYKWEVSDSHFTFDRLYTNSKRNIVRLSGCADDDGDGITDTYTAVITVTDGCDNVVASGSIVSYNVTDTDTVEFDVPTGDIGGGDISDICDDSDYFFYFDPLNATELDAPGDTNIYVIGGVPPYLWHIAGIGWEIDGCGSDPFKFSMNSGGGDDIKLVATDVVCNGGSKSCTVMVTDRCWKLPMHPAGTGTWTVDASCCCEETHDALAWDSGNPETIGPDNSAVMTISGGCTPYTISVSGTGFYLDAAHTLTELETSSTDITIYSDGACGSCVITCTDYCDDVITGYLRCTTGRWVDKISNECILSGTGTLLSEGGTPYKWNYEFVTGYQKQTQRTQSTGYSAYWIPCAVWSSKCTDYGIANCIDPTHTIPCWDSTPTLITCLRAFLGYYEWEC